MRRIEPNRIQPLRNLLLVRPYRKPERYGQHIILPDTTRKDTSGQLWELVKSNPRAEKLLGQRLPPDTILKIRLSAPGDPGGTYSGYRDLHDRMLFLLDAEKVYHIILPDWREG